jgi:tetratricopeptide repeat protein
MGPDVDTVREEFLFHLYRGSELLQDGRIHEAKEELESALRLQPLEAKGQDLLAVVYFRLGLYPRAIDIFADLVREFPRERTPRINLALCYLKTGQSQRARDLLEETMVMHPDYDRGWAYLGLSYEGLGDLWRAREAFLRAGQAGMARRMEERMGIAGDELETPTVERYYHTFGAGESMPASLGLTPNKTNPPPRMASSRPPRPPSLPPFETPVLTRASPPPPAVGDNPTAERFLRQREAPWPRGSTTFVPNPASGHAYVHVDGAFACRPEALDALSPSSEAPWHVEPWPSGGDGTWSATSGGLEGFVRVRGKGYVALAADEGRALAGLALQGGLFWIERRSLVGAALSLTLEQRRAPFDAAGAPGHWVRLEGQGLVVAGLPAKHTAYRIAQGESVLVRRGAICGWWGPLIAEPAPLARGASEPGHALISFSGDGFVLATGGGA